ncbi:hypothetical protein F4803DRAFT_52353 [Xylaria telfairii]|nr:hypothetical protein F4803DRAFT_52353 [Xylaria telfairii]
MCKYGLFLSSLLSRLLENAVRSVLCAITLGGHRLAEINSLSPLRRRPKVMLACECFLSASTGFQQIQSQASLPPLLFPPRLLANGLFVRADNYPFTFCSQTIVDYTLAMDSMDIMNHKYEVGKDT